MRPWTRTSGSNRLPEASEVLFLTLGCPAASLDTRLQGLKLHSFPAIRGLSAGVRQSGKLDRDWWPASGCFQLQTRVRRHATVGEEQAALGIPRRKPSASRPSRASRPRGPWMRQPELREACTFAAPCGARKAAGDASESCVAHAAESAAVRGRALGRVQAPGFQFRTPFFGSPGWVPVPVPDT